MSSFLLEIGTEELPFRFLSPMERELSTRFTSSLKFADLSYTSLTVHSTPRRCMMLIEGLAERQPMREDVIMGPPSRIAYDPNGNPSKAAEGFAKTNKVTVAMLEKVMTDKGEYLAVRVQKGGRSAQDVLSEMIPSIISSIPFPKRMRWGSGDFAYARPIRWIVALLDDEVVPFEIGGVSADRKTYGHREHGYGPYILRTVSDYNLVMQAGGVIPSGNDRRNIIIKGGDEQAKLNHGEVIWKESLLDEVCGLTEHPVPLFADFDEKYLDLPREVLLTSMEKHQKSFGIQDENGQILPHFLTILNITPPNWELVKKGWERVLRARLEDARFFWENDLKTTFDDWLEKLDHVIFLAPLGTMGDKTRRLSKICSWIAQNINTATSRPPVIKDSEAEKAGRLSKADLVSDMVGEFDTLQGIMGGIYARKKNEALSVSIAISEQYLPSGPDTPVPSSDLGAILSIADKADTLVGCFGLNMIPTGTADQYALRRAALGIARILLEKNFILNIPSLFDFVRSQYQNVEWHLEHDIAQSKLLEFFEARVKNLFITKGHDTLMVDAVTVPDAFNVWEIAKKLDSLEDFAKHEDFIKAAQTFKRVSNIIKKHTSDDPLDGIIIDELLVEDVEKSLAKNVREIIDSSIAVAKSGDYTAILHSAALLRPAIDAFFEGVMVMCEDEAIRKNRMNILYAIQKHVERAADFSALQI